jgi:hypothetical protein
VVPREDTGLDIAAADYVLIRRAQGNREDEEEGISQGEQESLLKDLYESPAGIIVRTQVRLWNETRRIAAIRDSRNVREGDANKVLWTATNETGHPRQLGSLVPETFGFVNKNDIPEGMGDWVSVASPEGTQRVVFSTRVEGHTGPLRIQVIGNPVKVPPRGPRSLRCRRFAATRTWRSRSNRR